MARLQDFQTVTPTSSDKLLVVQSQGQGLATIEDMAQKMFNATSLKDARIVSSRYGSSVSFKTSLVEPFVSCKAEIIAQQAGSGTPSLSNVRAITGFSSCNITSNGGSNTVSFGQTV